MALNLLRKYNELLDLASLSVTARTSSLKGVFNRDIANNDNFEFRKKALNPTPNDGVITMDTLFSHLTTVVTDKATRKREFDIQRSMRLHWIKFHIEEKRAENIRVFSVKEPDGFRTYIYDKVESYVIVLEPLRTKNEYYLLTAYYLMGKDLARDKFEKKFKRKLSEVL